MAYPETDIRSVLPASAPKYHYDPRADPLNVVYEETARKAKQAYEGHRLAERQKIITHGPSAASNVHALNVPQARTHEQILAECQARYDEMESEAAKPELQFPCSTCRWAVQGDWLSCRQPLVTGIAGKPVDNWDARLCGPEKALWEPRQSLWSRLFDWLEQVLA